MHRRRLVWQCKGCRQQTSVTAGIVLHATRTPLRTWFWAAYLVATHHPWISAKELQHRLGLSRYETASLILPSCAGRWSPRSASRSRTKSRSTSSSSAAWKEGLKGGRQRANKSASPSRSGAPAPGPCACRCSKTPRARRSGRSRRPRPHGRGRAHRRLVGTTAWARSATNAARAASSRRARRRAVAPRAHRGISNLEAWMHGTHRHVSPEHLPLYLDSGVFSHNRRRTPMSVRAVMRRCEPSGSCASS
jgi:hypothetical protein